MEHWWNGTGRGNWSTGRKTLYSVGGRWMNEYGTLVEWYWQGKTAATPVPVPLCPPQVSHGLLLLLSLCMRGGMFASNPLSHCIHLLSFLKPLRKFCHSFTAQLPVCRIHSVAVERVGTHVIGYNFKKRFWCGKTHYMAINPLKTERICFI
jgi:hypothetical protein